jgi:hypothetical protein
MLAFLELPTTVVFAAKIPWIVCRKPPSPNSKEHPEHETSTQCSGHIDICKDLWRLFALQLFNTECIHSSLSQCHRVLSWDAAWSPLELRWESAPNPLNRLSTTVYLLLEAISHMYIGVCIASRSCHFLLYRIEIVSLLYAQSMYHH